MLKQQRRITALTLAKVEADQLAAGTQNVEPVSAEIVYSPDQTLGMGIVGAKPVESEVAGSLCDVAPFV